MTTKSNSLYQTIVDQATSSVTAVAGGTYVMDNGASLVTITLPTANVIGDRFTIVGGSSGGWTIVYSTGQSIIFGSVTTTVTTGSLSSSNAGDNITLMCTTTNTGFTVLGAVGNITYV